MAATAASGPSMIAAQALGAPGEPRPGVRVWKQRKEEWILCNVTEAGSGGGGDSDEVQHLTSDAAKSGAQQIELRLYNIRDKQWYSLVMPRSATVERLRATVEAKLKISGGMQRFVHGGKLLQDRAPLSSLTTPAVSVPRILLAVMQRVHELKRHDSHNPSWYFNQGDFSEDSGSVDALEMTVSRRIALAGLGVFGNGEGSEYTSVIRCYEGSMAWNWREEGGSSLLAKAVHTYSCDPESCAAKLTFDEPCTLEPGNRYTIMVSVWGEPGVYGTNAEDTQVHEETGVEFSFFHSDSSSNGTDVRSGNFPSVYFYT